MTLAISFAKSVAIATVLSAFAVSSFAQTAAPAAEGASAPMHKKHHKMAAEHQKMAAAAPADAASGAPAMKKHHKAHEMKHDAAAPAAPAASK